MKKTVTALAALAAAVLCCRADGNFSVQTNDATVTVKAIAGSLPTLTEPFFQGVGLECDIRYVLGLLSVQSYRGIYLRWGI